MPEPRALVGAARTIQTRKPSLSAEKNRGEPWQRDCWDMYDLVPEYRYAVDWVGNLLSRAKLTVLENGKPTENPFALAALQDFAGGERGQADILRQLGIHFTVAGDAYVFGVETKAGDEWFVGASTETSKSGGVWKVDGKSLGRTKPIAVYLWRAHPRRPTKPNSPSRAVLSTLTQIVQLAKTVSAIADSRLIGAGILFLPSDMTFPARPTAIQNPGDPAPTHSVTPGSAQDFADLLSEVFGIAISDPSSAEARVPIIVQGEGEHLDKIKWQTFWSEFDQNAPEIRKELVTRVGRGMDMPPEVITGTADVNHWGSWAIEEAAIKVHSIPTLNGIVSSLTTGYLWPVLQGDVDDPTIFSFGYDDAGMRLRPDRSKEAVEAYDRLELSGLAMLRENGFDVTDQMGEEERREVIIRRLVEGSPSPDQIAAAAKYLKIDLPQDAGELRQVPDGAESPRGSVLEHPTRDIPDTQDESVTAALAVELMRSRERNETQALLWASEGFVLRALERCGNKLKSRLGARRPEGVAACDLYRVAIVQQAELDDLLDDAWSFVRSRDYGVPAARLEGVLDTYVRSLILSRQAYDRADLEVAIRTAFAERTAA
jgi:hypothetical protein